MTRIRYRKNNDTGNLVTVKPVLINENLVTITIHPVEFTFNISSLEDGEMLVGGQGNSLSQTKVLAKLALKDFGAVFQDEVRHKKVTPELTINS